jgi:DNA polymerase-3 subunit gamma/tau
MTLLRILAFRPAEATGGSGRQAGTRQPAPATSAGSSRPAAPSAAGEGDWPALLARLELKGPARQLAGNCQLVGRSGDHFRFLLDERAGSLHTRQLEERFLQSLRQLVGDSATLDIERGGADDTPVRRDEQARDERLEAARAALERDPNVQSLRERFGAVLQPDSIKPVG